MLFSHKLPTSPPAVTVVVTLFSSSSVTLLSSASTSLMATTRNNTCAAVPAPSPPQAVLRPAAATTAGVTSSAINLLEKDGEIISVANQLLAATPICPEALTNAAAHNLKRRGKPLLPTTIHDILPVKQTGSPQLYHSIYEKLLQSGRLQDCVVLLEEMDKAALLDRTKMNHLRFYQACKNQGAVKEAIRYTRLLQSSSTLQIYNMLLSVCRHARDTDGALRVLAMLESTGLKADCIFYTSLISACAKAGKVDLVFQIFHEMEAAGIEANVHTFAAMIDGCARAGQLPKAFGVYGIMISKNVKPDRVIFNTLINACGRAGAVERAFDVLSDMKAEATPVKPDHVTYGALIAACARGGQVDRALEVYKTMRANRIQGTPECYTAAVHACSQKGDLDAALSLYDDLKKDGVQPDEVFFSALIDVAGHSGQLDQAFSILQEMKRLGMKPGAVVYSSLMGVCSNLGNCNRAQELYKEIQATGLRPTVSTFNALMTTLCGVRQLKNALHVLEDMRKSGEAPNQISYSILLSACLKEEEPELAIELYRTARAAGVTPSIVMCDSITGLCLQHIQKSAPPPQILSSICPVPAGSSNNAPHEHWAAWALAVYRQTLGAGIVPTVESLSQLLGCLRTPEVPEPNYFDDRVVAFLGQSWPASPRHVVDGCGVYDPRALALFEEAAALGVVPTFSFTAGPIIVHAETMPVFAVEVCLLTLLKSLKHRHAAGARLPSVTVTYLLEKKEHFTSKGGQKIMNVAGRTGQAVTALLRRLRLKFQGHESSGEIHITVLAIRKWLQPNSTPQSFNPAFMHSEVNSSPYHQLVKNLSDQQRAIRMGGVSSPLEFAELDHIGGTEEEYNFKHSQSRRPKGPSEVRRRPPTLQ
ncbi:hypothetical protein CY35_16G076200 [Sphagnum magellanicum]|nr:hypothetical protein CY35_16G076200 [Sphagnum magellanicum]